MAVLLLVAIVFAATCSVQAAAATSPTHRLDPPPVPAWPSKFTAEFTVRVEQFGPEWSAKGVVYYDWETKVYRSKDPRTRLTLHMSCWGDCTSN